MDGALYFDNMEVGHQWRSRSRTITESDVCNFAALTGDFDPLHVDHEFASESPYGQPVAHGLLGLAFLAGLSSTCPAVHTVAFVTVRDWQFRKPIFFGDTVHVVTEITEKRPHGRRRGHVAWKRQLVNQRDEVVQEGVFETLVAVSPQNKNILQPQIFDQRSVA